MKKLELVVEGGALKGRRFGMKSGGVRLGRSSSNDISIPDEELSRNHCLFEGEVDGSIRLTDLASANGTYVNGESIGAKSVKLKVGDEIQVGETSLVVVEEGGAVVKKVPRAKEVDLGFGKSAAGGAKGAVGAANVGGGEKKRRSPVMNVLWAVTVCLLGAAMYVILFGEKGQEEIAPIEEKAEDVIEMRYEKVEADSNSIFRYYMVYQPDGTLKVMIDDVPEEDRHIVKSRTLNEKAKARLVEILTDPEVRGLDRTYTGAEVDAGELKSWELRIVYTTRVKVVRVINTQEPEAFKRIREKLEAFSKNELGIWAIQYSREKLVELAEKSAENARMKWEDRDVEFGNLAASIAAYKEALFYLETVNPKPNVYGIYKEALEMAEKELGARYDEQRFKADKAINLKDWTAAKEELTILCEIIPDREDERYREAAAKLMDVEKRLSKAKGAR